jgi:REP element-mobilizing transposase RayT
VQERGAQLHHVNGPADHLHLLLSLPRSVALADLMRSVKGGSSHWVRQEFADHRDFGWQHGYAAFSVSHSRLHHVYEYISRQPEHHAMVTFRDELRAFLKKHEIAYDDRHLSI